MASGDASPPAMPGTAGATQGWIIVEAEHEEAILTEGFKCKRRKEVPFTAYLPTHGAKAFTRWHKPEVGIALEVHGVDESLIEYKGSGGTIKLDHLPAENLRSGKFFSRTVDDHHPCPFCGKDREEKFKEMHTTVGKRYFHGAVELVAPGCCHDQQAERQQRLEEGMTVTLYHQTDKDSAQKILASGGKLLRGATGTAGGAIYLALSPLETRWKTIKRGVVLECEVQLGKILKSDVSDLLTPNYQDLQFAHLVQPESRGDEWVNLRLGDEIGDSILLSRGRDRHDGPSRDLPSGPEVVVFSWQQVMVKRVLDLAPDHPYVQAKKWLPEEVKQAHQKYKDGFLTFSQYEDVFFRDAECLQAYRGKTPEEHLDVAMNLLVEKHHEWLKARADLGAQ